MYMSEQLIDSAEELVRQRNAVYGNLLDTMPRTAQIWSGILGTEVNATDVVLCLIGLKMVRAAEVPDYSDNIDDILGYAEMFRKLLGPDMIQARSVDEYLDKKYRA